MLTVIGTSHRTQKKNGALMVNTRGPVCLFSGIVRILDGKKEHYRLQIFLMLKYNPQKLKFDKFQSKSDI